MTFGECVIECAKHRELVEQFDRLRGTKLSKVGTGAPIERMIDEATDRYNDDAAKWVEFVWDFVWTRLPPEAFTE